MSPCQTYIDTLRARGYRITKPRKAIIEAIAHSGSHVHAEQVFTRIQQKARSTDIATVYRTLELLVEEGLASRIDLDQGRVIYATGQHGLHIHLVCRHCGQVIDADQQLLIGLKQRLNVEYQFAADLQHISVLGLCNTCSSS